jgi:hypothetical protein
VSPRPPRRSIAATLRGVITTPRQAAKDITERLTGRFALDDDALKKGW